MAITGQPRSFHKKYSFVIEIDGIKSAGFQKCSELTAEVAKVEYFEGGSAIPIKSPGRLSFEDITLERGVATQVINGASGFGKIGYSYKRNLDIVQLDRDGSTLRRWSVTGAWPTKFKAGEWDNESDEVVIEVATLTYDFFNPA